MQQSRKQKAAYAGVFIVLIGFLIFAVLSSRDSKTTPPSGSSRIRSTSPDDDVPSKPTPGSTATSQPAEPSSSSSSSAVSNPKPSTTANTNGEQLVNSGPGETVTLFVVTVLAGTALAHVHQRRVGLK